MEYDFSVEEILDMPVMGEVLSEPALKNIDCVGQDELCKNEAHGECNHWLFCTAGNDSELY